jgi:hypothetical protein
MTQTTGSCVFLSLCYGSQKSSANLLAATIPVVLMTVPMSSLIFYNVTFFLQFASNLDHITLPSLADAASQTQNVTSSCSDAMRNVSRALFNQEEWAVQGESMLPCISFTN